MAQLGEAVVLGGRDGLKHLFLDAARVVMLLGAAAAISTVGSPGANAALAFLGLLLWLLGVCFLTLVPVADWYPQAAMVGATMANAVLNQCFALSLWN
ncbi:hypothetical protein BAE44_0015256 [Dichanthelium oligosanthes]|uniref:Uncharacterized protein n=1 Tax=Dichanthelium oligosanthes TaxID=888268 RepID=A0A1E5VF89_9POAL|nr:hypothetical protein BAE44_0015256 [Dichanthelium oligosanthes]